MINDQAVPTDPIVVGTDPSATPVADPDAVVTPTADMPGAGVPVQGPVVPPMEGAIPSTDAPVSPEPTSDQSGLGGAVPAAEETDNGEQQAV